MTRLKRQVEDLHAHHGRQVGAREGSIYHLIDQENMLLQGHIRHRYLQYHATIAQAKTANAVACLGERPPISHCLN